MRISDRIRAVERRLADTTSTREIVCRGGWADADSVTDIATAILPGGDRQSFEPVPGENVIAFRQRVRAAASAERAKLIVFGGFPMPESLSA